MSKIKDYIVTVTDEDSEESLAMSEQLRYIYPLAHELPRYRIEDDKED